MKISTKQLVYAAMAIALATVCSFIKLSHLPFGGSVTLFSMLFVTLAGYWFGPAVGIVSAVAYGILQFVLDPYFYSIPQMIIDYPVSFGALGLAGFFSNKKYGLQIGYVVGVLGRYIGACVTGYIFFGSYANFQTFFGKVAYSTTYNATYILPEMIATLVVISLPPVKNVFKMIKEKAQQ